MRKQALIGGAIIICGLFIVLSNLQSFNISKKSKNGEEAVQTYDVAKLKSLTVESTSTNIKLVASEDDQVRLKLYDSSKQSLELAKYVTSDLNGKELTLEVSSPRKWYMLFTINSSTLELAVPTELLQEVTVESKSGNISADKIVTTDSLSLGARSGNVKAENVNAPNFTAESSSGNITIEKLTAQAAEFESTSGNINIDQLSTKDAAVEASSGNIKVKHLTTDEIQLESTSGNITVEGETGSIDAKSNSGNIDLELVELTKDSELRNNSGNIKLSLDQADSLYVTHEKNSGSSNISKSGFEVKEQSRSKTVGVFGNGSVRLDVETTSGNFHLK